MQKRGLQVQMNEHGKMLEMTMKANKSRKYTGNSKYENRTHNNMMVRKSSALQLTEFKAQHHTNK